MNFSKIFTTIATYVGIFFPSAVTLYFLKKNIKEDIITVLDEDKPIILEEEIKPEEKQQEEEDLPPDEEEGEIDDDGEEDGEEEEDSTQEDETEEIPEPEDKKEEDPEPNDPPQDKDKRIFGVFGQLKFDEVLEWVNKVIEKKNLKNQSQ